jgi:phosphatidylserine decarboxylase
MPANDRRSKHCGVPGRFASSPRLAKRNLYAFYKREIFRLRRIPRLWQNLLADGFSPADFVICRLTPDKYHYNHTPVAGVVLDIYESEGQYHSCNPSPVVALATPYSKNRRVATVIDTDVTGGTRVGLVAIVEVVALMIGDIQQCYSESEYRNPRPIERGMFLERGCPKSLFRPGSSTTVLLFQNGRIQFAADLLVNVQRPDVESRYSQGLGKSLVETDVKVRSVIGRRKSDGEDEENEVSDDFQ